MAQFARFRYIARQWEIRGGAAPGRVGEPRPRAAGAAHKNLRPPWFQRPPAATTNKPLHQTPFGRW